MGKVTKEMQIENAPFFKSLRKKSTKLYLTKNRRVRKKLSPKETYQRDILEICLRISSLLNTLMLSKLFLEERKYVPVDNDLEIKNAAFIRYHIECYFIRVTTFKDLILKLIKRIYKYPIKENIGLEANLKRKADQDGEKTIAVLLHGLSILMKHIEPIRHKIAHGGYHDDVDLILIESEEVIRETNRNNNALSNEDYNETLQRLLIKNIMDMELIEFMMTTLILLVYKKMHPIRRIKEKEFLKTAT